MGGLERIFIDPGHGGTRDPGAVVGVTREADIVYGVSSHLLRELRPGYAATLSRAINDDPSQRERGRRADDFLADLSLHIHCDASAREMTRGMRCYVWPGNGRAKAVARSILAHAPLTLRAPANRTEIFETVSRRQWFEANRTHDNYWLDRARSVIKYPPCTSVLVELGFLTNPQDRTFLANCDNQRIIAARIAEALDIFA